MIFHLGTLLLRKERNWPVQYGSAYYMLSSGIPEAKTVHRWFFLNRCRELLTFPRRQMYRCVISVFV
jgi:hypothetical protein